MKRKLSMVLIMLMILGVINVPPGMAEEEAETENAIKSISLTAISISGNKCFYAGEDRAAEPISVKGIFDDGCERPLTGDSGITYQSSDETVFRFDGNKLFSTGKNGKAIITARYGGKTASVVMARQDARTEANQPIAPDANVSEADNAAYITTGVPGEPEGGHYDGSALSNWGNNWVVRLMRKSWASKNSDGTFTPSKSMNERWWDSGYRSMAGWFYDDGEDRTNDKQWLGFGAFSSDR